MDARTGTKRVREILRRLAGTDVVVDLPRRIADSVRYRGTVVAVGPRLVVVREIFDFEVCGLAILRIADIEKVAIADDQRRVRRILRAATATEAPECPVDPASWASVFRSIRAAGRFAIVECEHPGENDFDVGPVLTVGPRTATLRPYDTAGRAWPHSNQWSLGRVTCVRLQERYCEAFERHARGTRPAASDADTHGRSAPDDRGAEARSREANAALLRVAMRRSWSVRIRFAPRVRGWSTIEASVLAGGRLLLVAKAYDFAFDGWVLVRAADVASARRFESERFHDRVLAAEGRSPPPAPTIRIAGWVQALTDLAAARTPLFVRWSTDAEPDNVVVGVVERVRARDADFRAVSSTARWWPGTVAVPLRSLTSVSVGARYERTLVGNAHGTVPRPRTGPRD